MALGIREGEGKRCQIFSDFNFLFQGKVCTEKMLVGRSEFTAPFPFFSGMKQAQHRYMEVY